MIETEYRNTAIRRRATIAPVAESLAVPQFTAQFCVYERDAWSWRWRVVGTMRGERDVCEQFVQVWTGTQEAT